MIGRTYATLAMLLWVGWASAAAAQVKAGDRAAELSGVVDDRGRAVQLQTVRDKSIVLSLVQSSAKASAAMLRAWDTVAARYEARGVVFLTVVLDPKRESGQAFIKALGLRAQTVGYDPAGRTGETYRPRAMPTTFVVDARRTVREVLSGYKTGDERRLTGALDRIARP